MVVDHDHETGDCIVNHDLETADHIVNHDHKTSWIICLSWSWNSWIVDHDYEKTDHKCDHELEIADHIVDREATDRNCGRSLCVKWLKFFKIISFL